VVSTNVNGTSSTFVKKCSRTVGLGAMNSGKKTKRAPGQEGGAKLTHQRFDFPALKDKKTKGPTKCQDLDTR
jgi:hypothetical protein